MEEKYSHSDVMEAMRLVAMGTCGILAKKDAEQTLNKLPESLGKLVVASTLAALQTKSIAKGLCRDLAEMFGKEK